MSKKDDPNEAARLIGEGRRQAETRRIKKLCGESEEPPFDLSKANNYWAVGNGLPLPSLSPVEVATIAASLLPRQQSERAACETALRLIREAAALIEAEREKDRRTQGHLEDNEANRRMWRNLGKRIARSCKTGKTFRESLGESRSEFLDDTLYPFPISKAELYRLAGLEESKGRKRLDKSLKDWPYLVHKWQEFEAEKKGWPIPAAPTKDDCEKNRRAMQERWNTDGIIQDEFLLIAETESWSELRRLIAECREEN